MPLARPSLLGRVGDRHNLVIHLAAEQGGVTDEQKRRGQLISKRDLILRALGRRKK